MHWQKLGRIFDPREHALPGGCTAFAQSPQAVVFDDFVRIYFSTRAPDGEGMYISHVAFVDMTRDLRRVLRVAERPVMPTGGLGCFDEHGIFPLSPVRVGNRIHAYTTGWTRRVSVAVDTAIGLAISSDGGRTFERLGPGPVLAASQHEPCLVGDAFVRQVGPTWHMWYIFGTGWQRFDAAAAPDRTYKIGHATSTDGVRWHKEEGRRIIADRLGPDESQALPTVVQIGDRHHMFFCYRHSSDFRTNPDRGYRIGHAWSDDLHQWTRADDELALAGTPGDWDAEMQCYPHAFACGDEIYLLYNGNRFGREGFGAARLLR